MKKVILSMLAISILIFMSCSDDDDVNETSEMRGKLTRRVSTSIYEDASVKWASNYESTLTYGVNGFVKEIVTEGKEVATDEQGNSETENKVGKIVFEYNSSNQIVKEVGYSGELGNMKEEDVTTYTYDASGFITKKVEVDKLYDDTEIYTYEYKNGLMVKKINEEYPESVGTHEYDENGILTKYTDSYNVITYTFDGKEGALYNIVPEKYALLDPLFMSKQNMVKKQVKDTYDDSIKTYVIQNTYDSSGRIVKSVEDNSDSSNGVKSITTYEYFYE